MKATVNAESKQAG